MYFHIPYHSSSFCRGFINFAMDMFQLFSLFKAEVHNRAPVGTSELSETHRWPSLKVRLLRRISKTFCDRGRFVIVVFQG